MNRLTLGLALVLVGAAGPLQPLSAQNVRGDRFPTIFYLDSLEVTATRTARPVFLTPAAVSVVGAEAISRLSPRTVTDVLRELPGVDVTGVGAQQPRPVIRGLRGQRILLLQDGLRLNNTRRQQDFGEVPAIVDIAGIERVELVRGPASVLYGTDALGGVINVITRQPEPTDFHGVVSYQYGGAMGLQRGAVRAGAHRGRLGLDFAGQRRSAGDYEAPSGSFGDIQLGDGTPVRNTGIEDHTAAARLSLDLGDGHDLFVRGEVYRADDAGFGLVEPDAYAPGSPRIEITYPTQRFEKLTFGYDGVQLGGLADRLQVQAYAQSNERELAFDFFTGFGPTAPPGAGLTIENHNFTDLNTVGMRAEAKKLAGSILLTYGVDGFRDRSENTDRSVTTVVGFGPPSVEETAVPTVPNATYTSVGGFLQAERQFGDLTLIGGLRAQTIRAETRSTPGLTTDPEERSQSAVVGSLNGVVDLGGGWAAVASLGRGFRAPNLIEWFFEGPVPESRAYQTTNPDLKPETSVSIDLGVRLRRARGSLEAFVFQNTVKDGIRAEATGDTIQRLVVYSALNLDELRYRGIEVSGNVIPAEAVTLSGGYTHLSSEDVLDPENPTGETYSNRLFGNARFDIPGAPGWLEYHVRHNGEQKDVDLTGNPLGGILPSFTVHGVRAGFGPWRDDGISARVTVSVENLTDALYAEFANASFFRPEPGRHLRLSVELPF